MDQNDRKLILCDGIVPLCFPDEDICRVLHFWSDKYREKERDTILEETEETYQLEAVFPNAISFPQYPLCCGLLIRLRSGLLRIQKRSRYFPSKIGAFANIEIRFYHLVRTFSDSMGRQLIQQFFSPKSLLDMTIELSMKSINLSVPLQKDLNNHLVVVQPKYSHHYDDEPPKLLFCSDFLKRVCDYHAIVKRPEGTFDFNLDTETLYLIEKLSKLPREKCSRCLGCRQVYCGPCGLRMPNAEELLPPRVELPFDVLLLLHWQESLVKCTGITAAPLSTMDSVRYELWAKEKTPEDWDRLVGALHPDRDVLLFPDRDAVVASEFQWGNRSDIAQSLASLSLASSGAEKQAEVQSSMPIAGRKWRLVILEGSWNYAKTMAWQIIAYRKERHLPPLPCVILKDLTGEYWRFHHEGHSAVSTIEAIAHTARAAGLSTPQFDDLLLLFRLQKWRVMRSVRDGGKVPKAVEVCGTGLGSWKDITAARNEDCDENVEKDNGDGSGGEDGSKEKNIISINSNGYGFIFDHDITITLPSSDET